MSAPREPSKKTDAIPLSVLPVAVEPAPAGRAHGPVYAMLMVIMLAWGLNIPVVKALTSVMDEIWVGTLRMVVASAVLTVCVLLRDRRIPRLDRRQWTALAAAGFLMVYGNQLLFSHGMHLSTATTASLIMALSPALTVVVSALIFRERISFVRVAGLAQGLGGVTLVILQRAGAGPVTAGIGELALLCALLSFVLGGALVQRLARRLGALEIGWGIYLSGTCMLMLHAFIESGGRLLPAQTLGWRDWAFVLYSGVVGTAISNVGWYHAIATVGMGRAALFFYWLPIFGVASSVLLFGEAFSAWLLAGLALVLIGTRLGTAQKG
ncbi:MAG: DMT family transporter [Gammaproteobacteria bacterium]|nr:DMT family transporter [Gammaproteobacteria bacterium]